VIVFLDMDGVLVDFAHGTARLFGLPLDEVEANGDRTHDVAGVTQKEFWRKIESAGRRWWEDLPPYPWASRLVEACGAVGDVYVATSPPRDCPAAGSGKLAWIRRYLPEVYAARRYFVGTNKWLLAGPDRVLVDDDIRKYRAFTAAGGQAALFPRPWNMQHLPATATPEGLIEGIERGGEFDGHLR